MKNIRNIYDSYDKLYIHTHLSENKNEIREVLEIHKSCNSYTDVYDKNGLLTERIILAYYIYLNDTEIKKLLLSKCAIVHCPISNRFLSTGIMPLDHYLSLGLDIGLKTDIGAGYFTSILKEAREQSKTYSFIMNKDKPMY